MNSKVIQIAMSEKGVTMLCENGDVIFTPILMNGMEILGTPIQIVKTIEDPFIGVDMATGKDRTVTFETFNKLGCMYCNMELPQYDDAEMNKKVFQWHLDGHNGDMPQPEYDDGQGRSYDILDEELE